MKNYFIGFILVLISLFSFSNNVFAEEKNWTYNENYIEYLKENIDYDLLKNNTNDLIDYIKSNTNYDFIITFFLDNNIQQVRLKVYFFEDISKLKLKSKDWTSYSSRNSFEIVFRCIDNSSYKYKSLTTGFDFEEINEENINNMFNEMKINIDDFLINSNFSNSYNEAFISYSKNFIITSDKFTIPIYSSADLIYDNISDNNNEINIQFNDYLFTNNSSLNELIEHFGVLNSSKIILSKTYANDLEDNDIYNIRADFVDIYDSSYKYEFKTNSSDWVDITSFIKDASLYGYYIYDYVTYFNDVISFRVLDSNNEVIDENSIEVSELSYEPEFSIEGYKKVTIPAGYHYAYISGIKQGRVYWKFQSETSKIYSNLYYDNSERDWGSLEWPIRINERNNLTLVYSNPNASEWFTYQDFDLSSVERSDFILLEKYQYLEGYDTYSVDYWIPEDAYFSLVKITNNEQGGNDFDFDWKDPDTGEVSDGSHSSSSDTTHDSFFSDFTNSLNYFKDTIIGIFQNVTYFFNNLPIALKYFYMVIFVFILFIFLIRFIL